MGRIVRTLRALGLVVAAFGCGDDDDKQPLPGEQTRVDGGLDGSVAPGAGDARGDARTGNLDAALEGGVRFNNAFAIRGRLASAPGDKRVKGPGDAAIEHSITHVMAVNPSSANPVRYLQPVAADGTFAIGVDLNTPWVIVLVDSHYSGADMVAGVFRSSDLDLDSVAASAPGSVDLGDVNVGDDLVASASVTTSNLLTALGLSRAAATLLGEMDDISLRYVNPDIDGNGTIDVLEPDARYGLDFHLRYSMNDGSRNIALSSLLNQYADATTTRAVYGLGSAIAYWFNPTLFGTTSASDFRIRFPSGSGAYSAPPLQGSYSANVWIEDDSAFYTSAGSNSLGISFDSTQPFPVGEYDFEVKGRQLTFTDVRTHSLAELNAGASLIIPFLKLDARDTSCTGWSCAVTGFGYKWMKRGEAGWVAASAEEVALVVPQRGGFVGFQPGGVASKRLEYIIPGEPVEGTIPFAMPNNMMNVTSSEIAALTVGDLCHLGVSYDDTLGMRIFQGWDTNPACNAPPPTAP